MKEIQLTQGYVAMVDDEDYQRVSMFMWHTKIIRRSDKTIGHLYAETSVNVGGKTKHIFMHRLLLNPGKNMHVDHIDGNGLNNIRDNIRECTAKQNLANQRKYKKSSSVFKGVHKIKKSGMWRALILYGGKRVSLGCYALETDAAHAYDAAALKYFGEFARINTYDEA